MIRFAVSPSLKSSFLNDTHNRFTENSTLLSDNMNLPDNSSKIPIMGKDDIHLWLGRPVITSDSVQLYETCLSTGERERAKQFVQAIDHDFYIIGRGILRRLLGFYLRQDPAGLILKTNHQGKPYLDDDGAEASLRFNVSHSQGMVVLAFSRATELGVDLEYIHRERDFLEIATRYLPAEEAAILHAIPEKEKKQRFYQFWVKKEALLKLAGEGVFAAAGREEALKKGSFLHQLKTPPDYLAALACTIPNPDLVYFEIH